MTYPVTFPVIEVTQPLGVFYIASVPAYILLDTCYSDRLRANKRPDGTYELEGNQRAQSPTRLKQIAEYIDSDEMAFPNSIILSANFEPGSEELIRDGDVRWRVEFDDAADVGNRVGTLVIPSELKLGSIIDGQHRLFAFDRASSEKLNTSLVCSIFLDLPKPFQAYLFATINSTQRPVNRSQTYELFGYNIDEELPESWGPEKLAVFLARKLNAEPSSPLYKRIMIAAENDIVLSRSSAKSQKHWMVSMATVVDGIAALFSSNTARDSARLSKARLFSTKSRKLLKEVPDRSPLRSAYVDTNDKLIYEIVKTFLTAAEAQLFSKAKEGSFIVKTVGIQALFDFLKKIAPIAISEGDFSYGFFEKFLLRASDIDFSSEIYKNASGSGRTQIRTALEQSAQIP